MKSRLYGAFRIDDLGGSSPLAVLLVESSSPDRFAEDKLKDVLSVEAMNFSDFVTRVRPHLAQPSIATESGL